MSDNFIIEDFPMSAIEFEKRYATLHNIQQFSFFPKTIWEWVPLAHQGNRQGIDLSMRLGWFQYIFPD